MKFNDSSPCLFGIMAVELIELACLLALIAALVKGPGFQVTYAIGLALIVVSAGSAAWSSWIARTGHQPSPVLLPVNPQIRQFNVLSLVASIASIGVLCAAVL